MNRKSLIKELTAVHTALGEEWGETGARAAAANAEAYGRLSAILNILNEEEKGDINEE